MPRKAPEGLKQQRKKMAKHAKKQSTSTKRTATTASSRKAKQAPKKSRRSPAQDEEPSEDEAIQQQVTASDTEVHQADSDSDEEELSVQEENEQQLVTPPKSGHTEEESDESEEDSDEDDNSQGSDGPSFELSPTSKRGSAAVITKEITEEYKGKLRMSKQRTESLKKENKKLKAELKGKDEEIREKDIEINELKEENENLTTKYQAALSQTIGKKKEEVLKNKAMVTYVTKETKRQLWRTIKFLGDDEQLYVVAAKVLDMYGPEHLRINGHETEKELANKNLKRQEWIELYGTDVRTAINDQRSYVQAEQKKHAQLWQKNDGENYLPLPTCEDMWLVVQRKLESDDPDRAAYLRDLFDWWVNCHVAACAGSTHFGDKVRRTDNVSLALVKGSDRKAAVPPSTEAMAYVMYENCYGKWQEIHKWKEVDKNPADIPKYSSKRHEETKQWKGKYSDSCNGQNPYGGWDDEGLARFEEVKSAITTMRKDEAERIALVETACVERIMQAWLDERKRKATASGKTPSDVEEPAKKKNKKGRKGSAKKRVVITVDED